ncbi:MAG: BadF/BadG/BcrA/BcrD ATPase family protein [SAR324 cluster bacterium]|nr:BadF/BadG/BcrA/BcrD ATPase family protein [SAR324 cluster bacterium]
MFSLGIDGGGSTLRIGIYGESLKCIYLLELSETANPSVLGFAQAEELLKSTLQKTIDEAGIAPSTVHFVGAGMAGAAQNPDWLSAILNQSLPHAQITVAPDYEIALIGAHGERYGVLVLSGTGSAACGINASGESAHSGGWGYLLGDGGSGYWLGLEMLKSSTRVADGCMEETSLYQQTFTHLKISAPEELISWIYNPDRNNREISQMAPLVLACAAAGDLEAYRIVEDGAEHLYQLYLSVVKRLDFTNPPVMFAGGLLSSDTLLRRLLMQKIGLEKVPAPMYSPVEGAALMANLLKYR